MGFEVGKVAYKLAKKKINDKNQIDAEEFFFFVRLLGEDCITLESQILSEFENRGVDIFFKDIHGDLYRQYKLLNSSIKIHNLLIDKSEHIKELINLTKNTTKWRNQRKEVVRRPTEEE